VRRQRNEIRASQAGFTLVELAMVLVAVGVLVGGGIYGLNAWREGNERSETALKLATIEDALTLYAQTNARLPCPDTDTPPDGSENASGGTCTATAGGVPWQDLDIPRATVRDAWHSDIRYVVGGMADDGGTSPLRCPEDLSREGDIRVATPDVPSDAKALAAYVLVSLGRNNTPEGDNGGDASATFTVLPEDGIEDDMVRSRSPGRVLVDGGCRFQRFDPAVAPSGPPDDGEMPCVPNVFGGGMSATGEGGITLKGNPSLNNLPSDVLDAVTVDARGHLKGRYHASGTAGTTLPVPAAPPAPPNDSTEDYIAGKWPDVHRTLDSSSTFRTLTVMSSGSLTVTSTGSEALVLNVADEFAVEGASDLTVIGDTRIYAADLEIGGSGTVTLDGDSLTVVTVEGDFTVGGGAELVIDGNTLIYAEDFEVEGGGRVTVNDGILMIILSGDLSVEGGGMLNDGPSAGPGSLVVLAEGDVEFDGSGSAKGYIYADGEVELAGGSSVEGAIVGDSIEMKGGADFTYSPDAPGNISDDCP